MTLSLYCNIHQIWKYVGGGGVGGGSGSSKRAGSEREMRNANYFNLTMC